MSEYDYEAEYRENEADAALQRRRTFHARHARRTIAAALADLQAIMEDYDVRDTGRLVLPEQGQYDDVIDNLTERQVNALVAAHAVLTSKLRDLTRFLQDR